jgi:hypothetical protein
MAQVSLDVYATWFLETDADTAFDLIRTWCHLVTPEAAAEAIAKCAWYADDKAALFLAALKAEPGADLEAVVRAAFDRAGHHNWPELAAVLGGVRCHHLGGDAFLFDVC